MRRTFTAIALAAAALTISGAAQAHEDERDERHLMYQSSKAYSGGNKAASAWNMAVVGHEALAERGFNADVWVHRGTAYVGQWGFGDWATGNSRFCPVAPYNGVAVVDVRDPASPKRIATLATPDGTSVEDVVVYTARYGRHAGRDIAAGGIQDCAGSRHAPDPRDRGLMLWDVSDPASPVSLGFLDTGCCTRGLHEFEVQHRSDLRRTFAFATVPASGYPDANTASGYRDAAGRGDFRLLDITDPARPFEASTWGIRDIGGPFSGGQGCDADANYGHGAEPSDDGRLAFVSYWDAGFVRLDLSSPSRPVYTGRTLYPLDADGDGHSSQYDDRRKLLFAADEDFCKASGAGIEPGFGYLRVYDYSNPAAPSQIGSYRTANASGTSDPAAGDFTLHNNFLVGTELYQSWYSDGVRVLDVSNARAPREVAYFVPPAAPNPVKPSQRGVLSNTVQVWGVVVDEATGLVYASDMNSGLWILRRTDR